MTELGEIPIKPNLTGSWAETQFISFPNPSATPTRWASASPSSVWPIAGADDSPSEHTDTEWNCKAEMTACPETVFFIITILWYLQKHPFRLYHSLDASGQMCKTFLSLQLCMWLWRDRVSHPVTASNFLVHF